MDSDQYSPDFDDEYNFAPESRPRRWLALFAGLYAGIVLGIVSSNSVAQIGFWIKLGSLSAGVSWVLVFLVSIMGSFICIRLGLNAKLIAPIVRSFFIVCFVGVFTYFLALLFQGEGLGYLLSLMPIILPISFYWTKPQDSSFGFFSILFVGSGIFLSSFNLFTIPALIKPVMPNAVSENKDSDINVLVFNIDKSTPSKRVAEIIANENVEIALLQGVKTNEYLSNIVSGLGKNWGSNVFPENGNSTAILSKLRGKVEGLSVKEQNLTMMSFSINERLLRFVSCEAPSGRKSLQRRRLVDWILKKYRKEDQPVLLAGDFKFNPNMQWTFLLPIITDSTFYDKASWKALALLGSVEGYSPFANQSMRNLILRHEWIVAGSGVEIVSSSMAGNSFSEGRAAVLNVRLDENQKELKKD